MDIHRLRDTTETLLATKPEAADRERVACQAGSFEDALGDAEGPGIYC